MAPHVTCRVAAAGGLDLTPLCIIPGKAAWSLYVDALVLNDAGGVLSALSIAALAALAATRLPRVTVTKGGQRSGDGEWLCSPCDPCCCPEGWGSDVLSHALLYCRYRMMMSDGMHVLCSATCTTLLVS
jgi:hypothetical protein